MTSSIKLANWLWSGSFALVILSFFISITSMLRSSCSLRGEWEGNGLKCLIAERKAIKDQLDGLNPPDFIVDDVPSFPVPVRPISGTVLTGLGVAAGKATGMAKLVTHPKEGTKLEAGNILVAPSTDPGWTPLFLKVSGIVMET